MLFRYNFNNPVNSLSRSERQLKATILAVLKIFPGCVRQPAITRPLVIVVNSDFETFTKYLSGWIFIVPDKAFFGSVFQYPEF